MGDACDFPSFAANRALRKHCHELLQTHEEALSETLARWQVRAPWLSACSGQRAGHRLTADIWWKLLGRWVEGENFGNGSIHCVRGSIGYYGGAIWCLQEV